MRNISQARPSRAHPHKLIKQTSKQTDQAAIVPRALMSTFVDMLLIINSLSVLKRNVIDIEY